MPLWGITADMAFLFSFGGENAARFRVDMSFG